MKKNAAFPFLPPQKGRTKFFLIMKLTSVFMLAVALQASARGYSQEKISVSFDKVKLVTALKTIEKKSDFHFVYSNLVLKDQNTVTITANDIRVLTLLDKILSPAGLTYSLLANNLIVIRDVEQTVKSVHVTGKVIDEATGSPISGVSVQIKGTTIGTSTNVNGEFSLDAPDDAVLVLTSVGYGTKEVSVDGRSNITISLTASVVGLNEVVVTALGVKKLERGLVYAAAEVKGSEFTDSRQTNIASSLTGKITGVDATQIASGPGGSSRVVIRGAGALNSGANNQPLYVVDGAPISNNNQGASANATGFNYDRGDGISSMNPDDIESITVLKSGAAAALYGSQAANGVILITTKSGKANKGIGVDFNSNGLWGRPSTYPNYQYEYGSGRGGVKPTTQTQALQAGRISFGEKIDGSEVIQFDGVKRPYVAVPVKQNIKNFYRPMQNLTNTLAFYGGNASTNFRLSLSDLDAQSQTPNSDFKRQTANLAVHSSLGKNDFIVIDGNVQYGVEKGHNRPTVGYAEMNAGWATYLLGNTVDIRSLAPGYDAQGNEIEWNSVPAAPNPYFLVNKIVNNDRANRFIGTGNITVNLTKNISAHGMVSKDFKYQEAYNYVPMGTAFTPLGYYNSYNTKNDLDNLRATLNYNGNVSDFGIDAFVGVSRERANYLGTGIGGRDFIVRDFMSYTNLSTLDLANVNQPVRAEQHSGTNSMFASVDLDYKRVVYLSVTGRKDWFSTLNPGHNGIFYPSIGGSVIMSDIVSLPTAINFLKLRGSWAQVGNATVLPYAINPTFTLRTGGFNGIPVLDAQNRLLDPDLRPLTVTTSEGGFNIQFLNNRLGIDATYYYRLTTNNILRPSISNASGFLPGDQNVGTLENRGIELQLTGTPIRQRDFTWNSTLNFTWNRNKVLSLSPGLTTLSMGTSIASAVNIITQVGLPYATMQAYIYHHNDAGELVIDQTTGYPDRVLANIGVAIPPYMWGFSNDFHYKAFALNVLLDAKFGAKAYSDLARYANRFGLTKITLPGRDNGLELEGVDLNGNPYKKTWPTNLLDTYYDHMGNAYPGSVDVFSTDFVKLRSLVLSYRLPIKNLKFVKEATIAFVGQNLLILYRDKAVKEAGYDPEFEQTVGNVQGTSGAGEPRTRNYGFNLSLKF